MDYNILISIDEDDCLTGTVRELPGCISQGRNKEKLIENISEAIKGYMESLKIHNEPFPTINE